MGVNICKRLLSSVRKYVDSWIWGYLQRVLLTKYLVFGDPSRLQIARTAEVYSALFNVSSGKIVIEDYAMIGHNVSILTGTHDYHKFGRDRQFSYPISGRDVIIKEGAWLASNVTVLGPCTIGEHSVVAACSLVKEDVPPYAVVAGVPARVVEVIQHSNENETGL